MGHAPAAPLSRLRVVELEPSVAAAFAGKWLAALGAEVFKVESPGGASARHAGPADAELSARALYLERHRNGAELYLGCDRRQQRDFVLCWCERQGV